MSFIVKNTNSKKRIKQQRNTVTHYFVAERSDLITVLSRPLQNFNEIIKT